MEMNRFPKLFHQLDANNSQIYRRYRVVRSFHALYFRGLTLPNFALFTVQLYRPPFKKRKLGNVYFFFPIFIDVSFVDDANNEFVCFNNRGWWLLFIFWRFGKKKNTRHPMKVSRIVESFLFSRTEGYRFLFFLRCETRMHAR